MFPIKFQATFINSIIFIQLYAVVASPSPPFFSQPWGQDFHLKPAETGDTLSIGAVFSNDSVLFVNDLAAIIRKNILAVPGTMICPLEKPFASGMYVASIRNKSGIRGMPVAFTVFKEQ